MPRNFLPIAIPRLRFSPPCGPEWLHEVKHDGWRAQLHSRSGGAVIYSKNGNDISGRFAPIRDALLVLPPCTIDAEIIGCDGDGMPDFRGLMAGNSARFCAWCFDLLVVDGRDIRRRPLEERRARLKEMLFAADWTLIRFSDSFADGQELLKAAARLGLEGVVSKKRTAPYVAGPACGWVKVKTRECAKRTASATSCLSARDADQALRSVSDNHVFVICYDGRFDELPDHVRNQSPWQGMHRGEIEKLKANYRRALARDGYALVNCELAAFKPQV